jgi:hypothetical protein
MITIRIGDASKDFNSADPQWINQQINLRRQAGENVCVQITIHEGELSMVLATPTCGSGGGGGRPPTNHEAAIFKLWDDRGLKDNNFTGGNVVAFLQQLKKLL